MSDIKTAKTEIRCDVDSCGWSDEITFGELGAWHNKPCPSCGKGRVIGDDDIAVAAMIVGLAEYGFVAPSGSGKGKLIKIDTADFKVADQGRITALEQENAALKAQLGRVEKLWENCPDKGTEADAEDYVDAMTALLSTAPEVLAVVDAIVCEKCHEINPCSFELNLNGSRMPTHEGDYEHCGGVLVTRRVIISREASHE